MPWEKPANPSPVVRRRQPTSLTIMQNSPKAPSGELTGLWLEFETRVPGEKPRIARRDIYDVIGPEVRQTGKFSKRPTFDDTARIARSAALYQQTSILLSTSVPSGAFLAHTAMANLLSNAALLIKVINESSGKTIKQSFADLAPVRRNPVAIWRLAGARRAIAGLALGVAIDRPNIFALHEGVGLDSQGMPDLRQTIDIIANETAARGNDAFKARLTQGVLDTALEREALNRPTTGINTVALFSASTAQHIPWVKLASADDPNMAKLALAPDVMALNSRRSEVGIRRSRPNRPGAQRRPAARRMVAH